MTGTSGIQVNGVQPMAQPYHSLRELLAGYRGPGVSTLPPGAPALHDVGTLVTHRYGSPTVQYDPPVAQPRISVTGPRAGSATSRRRTDAVLLPLLLGGGGLFFTYKSVAAARAASSAREQMGQLVAAASRDAAAIAAPRTAAQAVAEAQSLVGHGGIRASTRIGRDVVTRVEQAGTSAYSSIVDAAAAANRLAPTSARGVFQAGEHYVPVAFDAPLSSITQYYHYGRYSGGWYDTPDIFGSSMTREVAYDQFVSGSRGIVSATSGEGNGMRSLGTTAEKALADGREAIADAPWKVPLFAAAAIGCGIGAYLLYDQLQGD